MSRNVIILVLCVKHTTNESRNEHDSKYQRSANKTLSESALSERLIIRYTMQVFSRSYCSKKIEASLNGSWLHILTAESSGWLQYCTWSCHTHDNAQLQMARQSSIDDNWCPNVCCERFSILLIFVPMCHLSSVRLPQISIISRLVPCFRFYRRYSCQKDPHFNPRYPRWL